MRGAALVAILLFISISLGRLPIKGPQQYEQLRNSLKARGSRDIDLCTSMANNRNAPDRLDSIPCNSSRDMSTLRAFPENARKVMVAATGIDSTMQHVQSHRSSWLIPVAEYYEASSLTTTIHTKPDNSGSAMDGSVCAMYAAPDAFNINDRNLTVYAQDVDMAESRYPPPSCPYEGWAKPKTSTVLQFKVTSRALASVLDPLQSAWQNRSLDPGTCPALQTYASANGDTIPGGLIRWITPHRGEGANGGVHCTGDPRYDIFDLKLVLTNLGRVEGFRADAHQRVYESTNEDADWWHLIGSQHVPENAMGKTAARPFMLVADMNGSTGGCTISWSKIIAAT
jgi:hypothetical protein